MIPWDVLMRGPCVTLSLGTSVPVKLRVTRDPDGNAPDD